VILFRYKAGEKPMRRAVTGFGFAEALIVGGGSRRLERIADLIAWEPFERLLAPVYAASTGRPAYPPLSMLKVLLLQQWYGLSDPAMEEALGDRLSFRRFADLPLDSAVPDHSTISRFRSELVRLGLAELVFTEATRQLAAKGLIIKTGTLIDATLVAAAAAEPPKQKGGGRSQADPDATWVKQGHKATFGYKLHVAVDQGSLIVRAAHLTAANVNEITLGPALVQGDERAVWADKGYVGPTMRAKLKAHGIKDRVQRRNSKSRRLTSREIKRNIMIARVRSRIEGVFGTLKRSYGLARMRYMGLARNAAASLVLLTAWNLARAADKST
jgi:IS5 family transposase